LWSNEQPTNTARNQGQVSYPFGHESQEEFQALHFSEWKVPLMKIRTCENCGEKFIVEDEEDTRLCSKPGEGCMEHNQAEDSDLYP
jgi:hypothetical protein